MPAGTPDRRPRGRHTRAFALITLAVMAVIACAGPETGDDRDPTPTPTVTPAATATAIPQPPTATPSPTSAPTGTAMPTRTTLASPTAAASPTATASPTVVPLVDRLPLLDDMPGQGYTIAEEGTRTAEELAAAYADPAAHLRRLDEWGFKQHLYRAFLLTNGNDDRLPPNLLATINLYGSDEQAEAALQWLEGLGTATGATPVDAPQIGDRAIALTVPTSAGVPTASIYVRDGSVLFVYFAEGGDPLPAVDHVATTVFGR